MNKFDKSMMETAIIWSKLSHCNRKKVGAVLASTDNRILMCGYNGVISGVNDNCCEEDVNCASCVDGKVCSVCNNTGKITVTKQTVIHAEKNVISYCAKNGIATANTKMYVTLSPCIDCATLLFQAGVKEIYYYEEYTCTKGIDFLLKNGIKIERFI